MVWKSFFLLAGAVLLTEKNPCKGRVGSNLKLSEEPVHCRAHRIKMHRQMLRLLQIFEFLRCSSFEKEGRCNPFG